MFCKSFEDINVRSKMHGPIFLSPCERPHVGVVPMRGGPKFYNTTGAAGGEHPEVSIYDPKIGHMDDHDVATIDNGSHGRTSHAYFAVARVMLCQRPLIV
jgi:hypothetical protein